MMRLLVVLSILFMSSLLAFEYKLQAKKVSSNIYCFFGEPQAINSKNNGNMVNSCFVEIGNHYLVIDSGPTYNYAKEAHSLIKKIKNLPVAYVINTHVHDDHWLGNSYYKKLGIDIIGSKKFQEEGKLETTRMQRMVLPEAYENTTQEFPNIFVDQEKKLKIDNQEIFIYSVNQKAHTKSDLLIYIPKLKAIFVGDVVFNDRVPSLRDGDINRWIETLQSIQEGNYKYIIGGHGSLINKHSIDFTYNYLVELKQKVLEAIEDGIDIEDATTSILMPEYKNVHMYDVLHKQNVETAYRTLEWEQ
ncbi:MBL fold metallo-hydrolase [Sulfurimonas sp. C5]|uniref:MBL fold metallo-hydrolase n=1 Tax=Sulfurimonas sp. C5 TaxID=3036947 RepID=UPI00245757D3|nr:MBL fold metallo-hydrolase [Sulfurimonas sp. C5]MDH4944464.1 MBL fold metallo-hydrolase [Sulfurimonas sp. C5]